MHKEGSDTSTTMLLTLLQAVTASLLFTRSLAAPPCTSARPQAICLQYMTPYSDNAYFWTLVVGSVNTPADQSVLTAMNGEFWSAIYGCSTPSSWYATCCAKYISGVYIDCDGPETGLPPVSTYNSLATGWHSYMPCAVDTPERVLANVIVTTDPAFATPYRCTSHCQSLGSNYHYAGVEYGTECHCGTALTGGVAPAAANATECNMRCSGDFTWPCGGSWRIKLYTNL